MYEREIGELVKKYCVDNNWIFIPEYENWDAVIKIRSILVGCQFKIKLSLKSIVQTILADGVDFKVLVFTEIPKIGVYNNLLIILDALKIIPVYITNKNLISIISRNEDSIFWGIKYRVRPRKRLLGFPVAVERVSGVSLPIQISDKQIILCKLEILYDNKGYLEYSDVYEIGVEKIPKRYFYPKNNKLYIKYRPSNDYPIVYQNLKENT